MVRWHYAARKNLVRGRIGEGIQWSFGTEGTEKLPIIVNRGN